VSLTGGGNHAHSISGRDVVYQFGGVCGQGCTGYVTGELRLTDDYTPGTNLTQSNFISFSYQSSSGSVAFDAAGLRLLEGGGILPTLSRPSIEWVGLDAVGNDTGFTACHVAGVPNNSFCPTNTSWQMLWVPVGIVDSGSLHTWTLIEGVPKVGIDTLQGSHCLNQNRVELYGSSDFDVSQVNPDTLFFNYRMADGPVPMCRMAYLNDDQYQDLSCKFVPGTAEVTLTGNMLDGSPFTGSGTICAAQ
jgi:hypothetical protein